MSRIGNAPVDVLDGVEVKIEGQIVTVKGPKGELQQEIDTCVSVENKDGQIVLSRESDHRFEANWLRFYSR